MDYLSALDASFLRVETPHAHMHIGWSATLELPVGTERLDTGALRRQLESRLHLVPRFRKVVADPAGGLIRPVWVDASKFRLEDHVTVHPRRVTSAELVAIGERFFSQQLRRDRPLWQLHVIPSLPGRRAVVLGKMHHAMADGIAAVQLGMLLFDASPTPSHDEPPPWKPQTPSAPLIAAGSVRDSALEQLRGARRMIGLGLTPGRGIRIADTMRRAAFGLAEDVRNPAPPSFLNAPIGPRRRLVGTSLPMSQVKAIKERTDTKLNDVVLAIVAGFIARLAAAHGEPPRDLRAMVPANVRKEAGGDRGNEITFLFVDLPVAASAPRRTEIIAERMQALKSSQRVGGTHDVMRLLEYMPPLVQGQAARLVASPRLYNLTVSNVPGPPIPLYMVGARVRTILPLIPIPDQHALSVGAISYDERLHVSAYVDPGIVRTTHRIPLMIKDAAHELELLTRASVQRERARARCAAPQPRRSVTAS